VGELVGRHLAPSQHDDRSHLLAEDRVRDADRRHLGDGGVLVEGVFDLDGIDVLAAADDDSFARSTM